MTVLGRLFEQRLLNPGPFGVTDDPSKIPANSELGGLGSAGRLVSEATALAHIDVYKCVTLIADAVSMMPFKAFRNVAGVRTPLERQPQLVVQANPEMSNFDLKQRIMIPLLTSGNTYNAITLRNPRGEPQFITPIHPSEVRRVYRDTTRADRAITYDLRSGARMTHFAFGGDMVHFPGAIRPGELQGISPIAAGRDGISLGMAAEEFGSRWFRDGAHPMGALETEQDLEDDDAKDVLASWMKAHGSRSRLPAVLDNGLKWNQITVSPDESQFIETRRLQGAQIAGLYRVPPHMVADTDRNTSWGSGIEEQGIGFVVYTLGPWISRLETALSSLLPRGQFIKFNMNQLLRGRQKDRFMSYAIGRQWGWLSVNDIRQLEDLPPVDGGDTYLQPLNMIEAEAALDVLLKGEPAP